MQRQQNPFEYRDQVIACLVNEPFYVSRDTSSDLTGAHYQIITDCKRRKFTPYACARLIWEAEAVKDLALPTKPSESEVVEHDGNCAAYGCTDVRLYEEAIATVRDLRAECERLRLAERGRDLKIRESILTVLDDGEVHVLGGESVKLPWPLDHSFPSVATEARIRFVDVVIERLNLPPTSRVP